MRFFTIAESELQRVYAQKLGSKGAYELLRDEIDEPLKGKTPKVIAQPFLAKLTGLPPLTGLVPRSNGWKQQRGRHEWETIVVSGMPSADEAAQPKMVQYVAVARAGAKVVVAAAVMTEALLADESPAMYGAVLKDALLKTTLTP
jgi:hypothetical protein